MALTFRDVKGDRLSAAEGDANIRDLDDRIQALEDNPPVAVSIDHFVVVGSLLTIYMTNGDVHGPFVLPMAQWRWTGEYVGGTTYLIGDIITNEGDVYFARVQHVAPDDFDPTLFTVDGFVYIKILSKSAQRYDIGGYWHDVILSGSDILYQTVFAADVTLYPLFDLSQCFLRVATTVSTIQLPIYKCDDAEVTIIGWMTFAPGVTVTADGGQHGTFEVADIYETLSFLAGERLTVGQPYESDPTAAGLSFTIATLTASL